MKTIEQSYEEIKNSEELKKQFADALKENKLEDFLKAHDCDASVKDVMTFLNGLKEGELTDDDLDKVAGGGCTTMTCYETCGCYDPLC